MTTRFTDRISVLRQSHLDESERKLLDDIEKYGWGIMHIREQHGHPGWSFTVGVYDTTGKPEIIEIGLKFNVAQSALNESARRLQQGLSLTGTRQPDIVGDVECEFHIVEQRWIGHVMGWAKWFYGDISFPVLQCVYPDLANRFPWEPGFHKGWRSRQPLLFAGAPVGDVEKHFWEANEIGSVYDGWIFEDDPHTGVLTTKLINDGEEPITYVYRDEDGDWQFHGASDSPPESAVLICLHHMVDRDATIKELADLPLGWCASREKVGDQWTREPKEPEAEEDQ